MPMATLHCLGASQEVGRSAFLLETDKRILLDYGIKVFDISGEPKYPLDFGHAIDAALITHAHLDHSGFVPALYRNQKIRWFATPPTREICNILWKDSMKIMREKLPYGAQHYQQALRNWAPVSYGQHVRIGQTFCRFLDAGHILGSAMIEIEYNKRVIAYTGDFKAEETKMHNGAKPIEDVDVLIIDSTYALKEHPNRKNLEEKLADEISETISNGGNVILPAFAAGRTQELISIIRAHNKNVPVFVDGMGKSITQIYLKYKKYIKDAVRFKKDVNSVYIVSNPRERIAAIRSPSVIITTAGMMEGGPVLDYLINVNSKSKIIFTGFNVEGTNGWKLLNKGYITLNGRDLEVSLPVEYFDFSAHASRTDILNFIKWANPEKIVIVHTDFGKEFERELCEDFGYDAVAPKLGDKIELN
jgi:putative mRNA 3-end processing factor